MKGQHLDIPAVFLHQIFAFERRQNLISPTSHMRSNIMRWSFWLVLNAALDNVLPVSRLFCSWFWRFMLLGVSWFSDVFKKDPWYPCSHICSNPISTTPELTFCPSIACLLNLCPISQETKGKVLAFSWKYMYWICTWWHDFIFFWKTQS